MASCAARRMTLRPVTANTPRVTFLRDSDANDSLEDLVAAATAAVVVSSEATLDASSAAKTAAESAFETAAESSFQTAAESSFQTVVLRAGTLATRRKLKCGSLRLDVRLEVDDHDGADDHPDDAADFNLDCRCGIAGASEDHFSFETPPPQVMLLPAAAVATATSPTIAWASRGRRFRKSSSESSAPLSVADGRSAIDANDAASRQAEFSAAAAALLAAAAFPRAASAGAAFNKPPRSPLASLTMIAPTSPPLGTQQLSPDTARHADDPRGVISHKPQRRRRQGHNHPHPAEPQPSVRQLSAPQAAARKLAELARGGLLSPATHIAATTASTKTTNDNPRRIGSVTCKGAATAPPTPTGLLTSPATSSSSTGSATTRPSAQPSGGSAVASPISVVRLSSRVGFVNWRHLPQRPGTAPHPASPHSVSPVAVARPVVNPRGSSKGDSRRQSFTLGDSLGVVGVASHGGVSEIGRGMSRSRSWSSSKGARDAHCARAGASATSVAASSTATAAAGGGFSNGKPASVALSIVPPSPSSTFLPLESRQPPRGQFSVRSHSAGSSQLDRPAGFGLPPLSPQGQHTISSFQASSLKSAAHAANAAFSFRSLSAESSLSNIQTCYNPQPMPSLANLQVFIPLQSSPQFLSPPLSPLSVSSFGTPMSSPLRSALKHSPSVDGRRASMEDFEVQRQCGADAGCSTENERGSLKRRVSFSDNLHVICLGDLADSSRSIS
ncbi:unnamed protein product [Closterium sp. NIES-53]